MNEVHCRCACGKTSLVVAGPLLGRVRCHCTLCQSANRAAFADSTVLSARFVPLERVEHVRFETLRKTRAIERGFCRSCGRFVVAYSNTLPFFSLAFVPAACYPKQVPLPEPAMHIYYESRVADVADDLPKHVGAWSSKIAFLRMILKARMSGSIAPGASR